jgi:hypothetical protein
MGSLQEKSEALMPKYDENTDTQNPRKTRLEHLNFELWIGLEFRYPDFTFSAV